MSRRLVAVLAATLVASLGATVPGARADSPVDAPARRVEPVVLSGAQVPEWSRLPATGMANPYPSGANTFPGADGARDAHNGTLVVPPDVRSGAPVDSIAAYRWDAGEWVEVPVQVDERFPYFLANGPSDFAFYSGTDEELTYEWDVESWKKTAGTCEARYPDGAEAMQDPVASLDDDDEIVFMASDAGDRVPSGAPGPEGTGADRQDVRLVDPRDPSSESYVYLFVQDEGSSFTADDGYVRYERDANADEWIDRFTFADEDPEKLGTSNTGYGPNLAGTVCTDDPRTADVETQRETADRFPRDGVTVSTDAYRWRATGRWMIRDLRVAAPGGPGDYGPDLIDRWKGRAFQQSPDSTISLVGFEDEQVNWEANSALLGEKTGPVRAIREVWGADSGTNVTKTETFYRDAVTYRYRVRVHPIPPDGLYTSWDYNAGVATVYYNETKTEGVAVDGVNDDIGNVDEAPGIGPAFFDAPDPTFTKPLAFLNWEQVSGAGDAGSLVYMFEIKNAQSLENPAVTPYYRDDACFDDGTGDDPSPRAYPGESYEWLTGRNDATANEYLARPCYTAAEEGYDGPYRQGCFACHGVHYFVTGDTDNLFSPKPVTEIDGQQWQWAVPTSEPTNVGDAYANTVKTPLLAVALLQENPSEGGGGAEQTSLAFTDASDSSAQFSDDAHLAVRLEDSQGNGVSGKTIDFTLSNSDGAARDVEATTGEDGVARVTTTIEESPGDYEVAARFDGDEDHAGSAAAAPFAVEKEDTVASLSVTGQGIKRVLEARLVDEDSGAGIAGLEIVFHGDGEEIGRMTTDTSGRAILNPPPRFRGGRHDFEASFAGDAFYRASSATASS